MMAKLSSTELLFERQEDIMKKLILGSTLAVILFLTASTIPALGAVEEPWSEIEARTKFLRTKHYIETIRVHSDAYSERQGQGRKRGSRTVSRSRDFARRL